MLFVPQTVMYRCMCLRFFRRLGWCLERKFIGAVISWPSPLGEIPQLRGHPRSSHGPGIHPIRDEPLPPSSSEETPLPWCRHNVTISSDAIKKIKFFILIMCLSLYDHQAKASTHRKGLMCSKNRATTSQNQTLTFAKTENSSQTHSPSHH